ANSPKPGTYSSEVVLNHPAGEFTEGNFASGGGFSKLFKRPSWQKGVANTKDGHRGIPDISFSGGINHGFLASCGVCAGITEPSCFAAGGTSVGSSAWAALTVLADQLAGRRLGFINEALYKIGMNPIWNALTYHDTKVGNNAVTEFDINDSPVNVPGFDALK